MRRIVPLLLLGLAAASPITRGTRGPVDMSLADNGGVSTSPGYTLRRTPPAAPQGGPVFEPAPVPNMDLSAPQQRASNDPSLEPGLFQPRRQFRGDGFSPYSTAQEDQEKKFRPTPGFKLRIPLDQ